MNKHISKIAQRYRSAVIDKCCESGCSIKLDNVNLQLILQAEKLAATQNTVPEKACDCIAFIQKKASQYA